MTDFTYQPPFPLAKDETKYRRIEGSEKFVTIERFNGQDMLKIDPEALTALTNTAMRDLSFMLRPEHNNQVAKILDDPDSSANEKGVALAFLKNAEVSSHLELPMCQDTGTAIIMGKKGQNVWTGTDDAKALSKGVFKTYTEENLRYSQTVPLDMYTEINSGTFCYDNRVLFETLKVIGNDNSQGEYYLTDTIKILHDKGLRVSVVASDNPDELRGVNSAEQLSQLGEIFADRLQ